MEQNNFNNEKSKLSFNMAVDYNSKIAEYLHEVETKWARGNLRGSLYSLRNVWHKMSPFLEDDENKVIEKCFDKIDERLNSIKTNKDRWLISKNLEKMISYLGKKLNELGLLIPTSEDPRFLFKKK